jgi:hypothetical protein
MNNRKLVPVSTVAKDYGAVDQTGIESLARQTGCLEYVAGIPHVFIGSFRRAYKAALRATGEARVVVSAKLANQLTDATRVKMQLGKIPGRLKKLEVELQQAGVQATVHVLAFKRDEAAQRVTEITAKIREQRELMAKLEGELNALTAKKPQTPTAKPPTKG